MKALIILASTLLLAGCYEDTDVTLHQAGEYKGKSDEHALSAEAREERLKERFLAVQTDR